MADFPLFDPFLVENGVGFIECSGRNDDLGVGVGVDGAPEVGAGVDGGTVGAGVNGALVGAGVDGGKEDPWSWGWEHRDRACLVEGRRCIHLLYNGNDDVKGVSNWIDDNET
eukprot:scaffold56804_cov75-Attheya_sp.AAC.1